MGNFCVYVYRHPITNQPIYVGKGQGRRWKAHLRGCKHNKRFDKLIRSFETPPLIEKVMEGVSNEIAITEEIRLIALWGRKGLDKGGILMNYTKGGEGLNGMKRPRESVERSASKQRGVPRPHTSKTVSIATKLAMEDPAIRKKISDKKKGVPCPEITKLKIAPILSKMRRGAGNPAAKTWTVISPSGEITVTDDLMGFCTERGLSYVGLKSSYRSNRPVQKGNTVGWQLLQHIRERW